MVANELPLDIQTLHTLVFVSLGVCAQLLQSCLTLCDPMDCSLPGFSVHGVLQARILEWVVISFSRESRPGIETTSPTEPPRKHHFTPYRKPT